MLDDALRSHVELNIILTSSQQPIETNSPFSKHHACGKLAPLPLLHVDYSVV